MDRIRVRRVIAMAIVVVASGALQACAVATGPFAPSREAQANRSMTSHYDVLRQQSVRSFHSASVAKGSGGVFDYKYY